MHVITQDRLLCLNDGHARFITADALTAYVRQFEAEATEAAWCPPTGNQPRAEGATMEREPSPGHAKTAGTWERSTHRPPQASIRADLRAVRGSDIICRSGSVIVQVRGRRPRAVPVLARYHQPPLASAAFGRDGLVTGGTDPERGNITNPLVTALAGGTGLSRLDTSRLRATWLADCAELPGLATFMRAAGITCSQRLGDIIATLEPGDEAAAALFPWGSNRPRRQAI